MRNLLAAVGKAVRLAAIVTFLVVAGTLIITRPVGQPEPIASGSDSRLGASPRSERGEAPVFALIETLRPLAARIQVDGRDSDWSGVPTFPDGAGDAQQDPSRDIIQTSIAPREQDVVIRIVTAGRPARDELAFWFNLDFQGNQQDDLQLGVSPAGRHTIWTFGASRVDRQALMAGVQVAIGEVVEIRVPYASLESPAVRNEPGTQAAARARPWIRVAPFTWNAESRQYIDYGASAASFRLTRTPYDLNPPLPPSTVPPRSVELPLNGKWYLGQGAFGTWTHHSTWAYDLYIVDRTNHPSRIRDSKRNEDYYSWAQPVFSPLRARVIRTHSSTRDGSPRGGRLGGTPNEAYLDLDGTAQLRFAHFREGRVDVDAEATVSKGTVLGVVGNSGPSAWPHLHIDLWARSGRQTIPLRFSNVRVSLNATPNDPWSRHLSAWEPREGYFVERLEPFRD